MFISTTTRSTASRNRRRSTSSAGRSAAVGSAGAELQRKVAPTAGLSLRGAAPPPPMNRSATARAHSPLVGSATTAPPIQRKSPSNRSFVISGIQPVKKQRPNFVYFELASRQLTKAEAAEVDAFAARHAKAPEIHLYGYASEEGGKRNNRALAAGRMQAVKQRLLQAGKGRQPYAGKIILHNKVEFSKDKVHYRRYRAVELSTGGSVLGGKSAGKPRDCTEAENKVIDAARKRNLTRMSLALAKIEAFKRDPKKHPKVQQVLDDNLKDHGTATVEELLKIWLPHQFCMLIAT